jgi:hypothetical protein
MIPERRRQKKDAMKVEGGCYCGQVRYAADGEPMMRAQCHCRECQYILGGAPNMFMATPIDGFGYTKGEPKQFTRSDLDRAVTREFCPECGTDMVTRVPGLPAIILKVGTLDDPTVFDPQMAIYTSTSSRSTRYPWACRRSSGCRGVERIRAIVDRSGRLIRSLENRYGNAAHRESIAAGARPQHGLR